MGPDGTQTVVTERPATSSPYGPNVDDLIIKEARRRYRRRLCAIWAVGAIALSLVGLGIANMRGNPTQRPKATTASTRPSPQPAIVSSCSVGQLVATAAFNQSDTDLGAIKLTNTSARPCSLSGQPRLVIVNGTGSALGLNETTFQRAGLPPPPTKPIVLAANQTVPQAIVELDWTWCGEPPGPLRFRVQFPGWRQVLTVPNSAIAPLGFVPAGCVYSGGIPLLAVDGVRGLGQVGIETTGS